MKLEKLGKELHKLGIKISKAEHYRLKEECKRTGRSPEDLIHVIIGHWGSHEQEYNSWTDYENTLPKYGESEFKGYYRS